MNQLQADIELNQYIDHTLLKADATQAEILQLVFEAKKYNFKSVCVNPYYVNFIYNNLIGTNIKICTVIGFPLGASTIETKLFEAKQAIKNGANELDMVINIGALKDNKLDYILKEIKALKSFCNKEIILKVIIETALLTEKEKITICKIVSEAHADFIKTSTGFSNSGATIEDIKLMRQNLSPKVKIKASGGIKTRDFAIELIKAGASRIGTSNGIALINEEVSNSDY